LIFCGKKSAMFKKKPIILIPFIKINLPRGVLRPVAGIKRGGLTALRGVIDGKIRLLDGF
jgi:hypothetical protein